MYYPKNPCITESILNLFYLRTVSANLQLLYIFCSVLITSVFPKEMKIQIRNFVQVNQLGVFVFSTGVCF
jgi:hypothetical protein